MVLAANGAFLTDLLRPVDDKGHANPTAISVGFIAFEGGIAGHRPASGVVIERGWPTEIIKQGEHFLDAVF